MRSPIQYCGGKGNMAAKLLPLVPAGGRPYVEPYCGGASLFFAREPAPVEVLNDLDGDVVNLFRCLQNRETFRELAHRLLWTPYARAEFARAIETCRRSSDPVDRAWAFFVCQNQGFGGTPSTTAGNWGRAISQSTRGMADTTAKWRARLSELRAYRHRLFRVQIDQRDALEAIRYWDGPETVFYVDPPYVHDTRVDAAVYRHEPDNDHHRALVETLLACRGAVVLSGYDHDTYRPLTDAGWERLVFQTACYAASRGRGTRLRGTWAALTHAPRTEVVWRNPAAVAAQPARTRELFEVPAPDAETAGG